MRFEPDVQVGEVRVFADVAEPLVAAVIEARGLSGYRIVPVSPYPVPASDREVAVGPRVFQLWNVCPAAKRFAERSWVADTLTPGQLAELREAVRAVEALPPMRMGDYERRHLVRGGDFRPLSTKAPVPKPSFFLVPRTWAIAATFMIGLGVAWLLLRDGGETRVGAARVWTLQMQRPERVEALEPPAEAAAPEPSLAVAETEVAMPTVEPPPLPAPSAPERMAAPRSRAVRPHMEENARAVAHVKAKAQPRKDTVVAGLPNAGEREAEVMQTLRDLKAQQRADGSWGDRPLLDTALVVITLMAHGETPTSAEFGATLVNGVRYLTEARLAGEERGVVQAAACALCGASVEMRNPNVRTAAERTLASIGDNRSVEAGRDWSGLFADLTAPDDRAVPPRGYAAARPDADAVAESCAFVLRLLKK